MACPHLDTSGDKCVSSVVAANVSYV